MMDMDKSTVAIVHRTHINAIHIPHRSAVDFHYDIISPSKLWGNLLRGLALVPRLA